MRATYDRELQQLDATFEMARRESVDELREKLLLLAGGPARFVGTGGTLALAQLAAALHERLSGQLAGVATPLALITSPPMISCGALFFSARARHPDALLTLRRLEAGDYRPSILVTHRNPAELSNLGPEIDFVQVPAPEIREGFLATNSVMAMATMLVRAAGEELTRDLIDGLSGYEAPRVVERRQILVVFPDNLKPVATDFETRCSELGLASVQLSDLRNIAHGRHTGLAHRADETVILLLSDAGSVALSSKVADVLKHSGAAQVHWHADCSGGASTLRLLAASMHATAAIAKEMNVDAARPSVPEFGRRLYHLPIRKILQSKPAGPIELKVRALGAGGIDSGLAQSYQEAFSAWKKALAEVEIGGVVLDYDGTVCTTKDRFDLPGQEMQESLNRLLDHGLVLGFASGRGKSLYEDLRKWVPSRHWEGISLGLYNGAVRLRLSDQLPDLHEPSTLMLEVGDRLQASPLAGLVGWESRAGQVTIGPRADTFFQSVRLVTLIRDVMAESPSLPVKVVASAHSVDVVAEDTTKVSVLEGVARRCEGEVLAIGDQGGSGGNDFELLAATPWSISVDLCSADPSRCWSVDQRGRRGPRALVAALRQLKGGKGRVRMRFAAGTRSSRTDA
jgi:hypothetical protein